MKKIKRLMIISVLLLLMVGCKSNNNLEELHISAAASLKEVMGEIKSEFEKQNKNIKLSINYGGSGSLKQQIQQGAPCDVFISAGKEQVYDLDKEGLLISDSIEEFTKNSLVLITSKNNSLEKINDLSKNNINHIGIGNIDSVPVGKYTNEVLINLNLKDRLNEKLVFGKDVKEVLAWVASENADAGFVYLTDVINNKDINIVDIIDEKYHSPIVYPVAITNQSKKYEESKLFEEFLLSKDVKNILKKYGYK